MKRVLVVGYQPRNERMYPHTYDVLDLLEKHCELDYFGGDDRAYISYRLGVVPRGLDLYRWASFFYHIYWGCLRIIIIHWELWRRTRKAEVIIAVDHSALHYVSKFKRRAQELIFWSQDYLSNDEPWMSSPWVRRLIRQNRNEIRQAGLIIIQDPRRGGILDTILGSREIPKFYLPICLANGADSAGLALAGSGRIPKGTVTLMQLGAIQVERNSHVILQAFQEWPENIQLHFKGFVSPEVKPFISRAARKPLVYPPSSTYKEMRETIGLADIGIISCAIKTLNTNFFSMASGQLAEFCRQGIPVIVLDIEEMGEFVARQQCGLPIETINELPAALTRISGDYERYCMKSYQTYAEYFELGRYAESLMRAIGLSD